MIKGWEIDGLRVPLEEVGNEMFIADWPVSVLLQVLEDSQELRTRDWRVLRASELGRCLRQRFLKRQKEFWLSPDDVWLPLVGRGVHLELSRLASGFFSPEEVLLEQRLSYPYRLRGEEVAGEEIVLTGQIDFYHRPSGTLVDYKTTSSVWHKDAASWEYLVQQNVYAQLLRWAGEEPKKSYLWFVEPKRGRSGVRRRLIEVGLWTEDEVVSLIEELGRIIVLAGRDGILPPPFQEGDDGYWQCRFCPVQQACRALEKGG